MKNDHKRLSAFVTVIALLFLATPFMNVIMLTDGPFHFLYSGALLFCFWIFIIGQSFKGFLMYRDRSGGSEDDLPEDHKG